MYTRSTRKFIGRYAVREQCVWFDVADYAIPAERRAWNKALELRRFRMLRLRLRNQFSVHFIYH